MPERDWQKDWELCMKATPGPWVVRDEFSVCSPNSPVIHACAVGHECDLRRKVGHIHYQPYGRNKVVIDCRPVSWTSTCQARANAHFIAEAREALPYWLQRVRELEADIAWLLQEYGESEEPMSEDAMELKERCRVLKERDELRAQVEKLEAVAEAAREVIRKAGYELQLKDDGYSEIWVVPHEQIGKLARALGLAEKAK